MSNASGYWIDAPGQGSLRDVPISPAKEHDVALRATHTGISPGTERLVGLGNVPASCHEAMACRGMLGSFLLPALYGYSFVGEVEAGERRGQRAFAMRPHQTRAVVSRDELRWLPDNVPSPRATLFPNLETARNAVWDASPAIDDQVAVIGAGAVGLLLAFVLAHDGHTNVVVTDIQEQRLRYAEQLPWIARVAHSDDLASGAFDHAFHCSASSGGLQRAIDALGFEGLVTELSWYGERSVDVQLGGSFHYQRKRIHASQVGTIARSHREAGFDARAANVMQLLADPSLDALLTETIAFAELPAAFARLYVGELGAPCPVVRYDD